MKIEIIPTWLCRRLEAAPIVLLKTSCFLFVLLLFLRCCRQSGCWVSLFSPARWLVPTRTPPRPKAVAPSHGMAGRSQLVAVPAQDGVASLAGCQLLEGAFWRAAGRFSQCFLLGEVDRPCRFTLRQNEPGDGGVGTHLSGGAVCGIGAVVELSVKLPGVKVQNKLSQFALHTGRTAHFQKEAWKWRERDCQGYSFIYFSATFAGSASRAELRNICSVFVLLTFFFLLWCLNNKIPNIQFKIIPTKDEKYKHLKKKGSQLHSLF